MLLRDPVSAEFLKNNGYVLLDLDIRHELNVIEHFIQEKGAISGPGFYYSLMANTYEQNLTIQDFFHNALVTFYQQTFLDYRVISESFLAKPKATQQELFLHQDWCYTDESHFEGYNIWIPLIDVNEKNGCLFFLPGTHLIFKNYRSGTHFTARISTAELTVEVIKVPMKRGQVLLFHPAVFHGSYPNETDTDRVVVTATVMQKHAPFLHYWKKDNDNTRVYEVDDNALLKELEALAMGEKPNGKLLREINYRHKMLTAKDLGNYDQ